MTARLDDIKIHMEKLGCDVARFCDSSGLECLQTTLEDAEYLVVYSDRMYCAGFLEVYAKLVESLQECYEIPLLPFRNI